MAEHILRRHVADEGLDVEVDSSGTATWHVGERADDRAVQTLRRAGYAFAHAARQFRPQWFSRYDLIIALDEGHYRELRLMARTAEDHGKVRLLREFDPDADDLDVPDPYFGDQAGFELVRELIETAVAGIIDEIRESLKSR
jgi:low molecular weight protein-tyrosine phosphatase